MAKKTGKIIPQPGVNEEYDEAIAEIKQIEKELADYLKQQSKELRCVRTFFGFFEYRILIVNFIKFYFKSINYFGTSKNRYQLEMPESACKNLSEDYELTSSRKGFKR